MNGSADNTISQYDKRTLEDRRQPHTALQMSLHGGYPPGKILIKTTGIGFRAGERRHRLHAHTSWPLAIIRWKSRYSATRSASN
jgi:hypothetical protein